MSSNMEITSTEMIRPSSPTPQHLRNLRLSFLDQMVPPFYIPLIFFYELNQPQIQESLKKSLSNVLTQFYPLAGRLSRESFTIDCNDTGALFFECKVHENISKVIEDQAIGELPKYLPINGADQANGTVLAVQINIFDCGGIAVAVQMHHNAGDANSFVSFLNAWAAATRGGGGDQTSTLTSPIFDAATLFPPKDLRSIPKPEIPFTTDKIVTKRIVFDKEKMETLKLQEASQAIKIPTRVEAVSSFLLKRIRNASRVRGSKEYLVVAHAVNLRPRMNPPLPDRTFGNVISSAVGVLPVDDTDEGEVVEILRNAAAQIDGDCVKELLHGDYHDHHEYFKTVKNFEENYVKGNIEPCVFSSWTRFPVYDVDYGWGRPLWVGITLVPCRHIVTMMPTSSGEGMEAWINILEEDAASMDFHI